MKLPSQALTAVATFVATAVTLLFVLPTSVDAAGSTFVKIRDYKSKAKSGQASVVGNRLLVGDGSGPLTVDGTVTVGGTVNATLPGTTPLAMDCAVATVPTDSFQGCTMAIPAGRRFVIDTVTVVATSAVGSAAPGAWITVKTGGVNHDYFLLLTFQRYYAGNALAYYVTAQPSITLYPDSGTNVVGFISRAGAGQASGGFSITGHLE